MTELAIVATGLPQQHGPLGLLSGEEFTPQATAFDRALLDLTGPVVGLILDADHRAAPHSARLARAHFAGLNAETVELDMHSADPLPDYDVAYIGGGSPADLLQCLHDNPRWREVMARWENGKGLAGSSAGAMVLCAHTLVPREGDHVPTRWARGVGPVTGVALAVHASSRDNAWLENISGNAPVRVLALDDATGIIVSPGKSIITAGPGRAWFSRPNA